jgi:hypothetical protein
MAPNYDNRKFRIVGNSPNGEADEDTLFTYHQKGNVVWGTYSGGRILQGVILARVGEEGNLHIRYSHLNDRHEFRAGTCVSIPEVLDDGRLRMHESWLWADGDNSTGRSVLEEI